METIPREFLGNTIAGSLFTFVFGCWALYWMVNHIYWFCYGRKNFKRNDYGYIFAALLAGGWAGGCFFMTVWAWLEYLGITHLSLD